MAQLRPIVSHQRWVPIHSLTIASPEREQQGEQDAGPRPMCQRQRVQVTAYYHLQQLGHASRQGSVKLQQILWFLRASPEEHGMPVQRLRSRPGYRRTADGECPRLTGGDDGNVIA